MTKPAKSSNVRRFLQGAATVLTVSLALTLRIEHACSDKSEPRVTPAKALPTSNAGLGDPFHFLERWIQARLAESRVAWRDVRP
jgi:hypothetical protein